MTRRSSNQWLSFYERRRCLADVRAVDRANQPAQPSPQRIADTVSWCREDAAISIAVMSGEKRADPKAGPSLGRKRSEERSPSCVGSRNNG